MSEVISFLDRKPKKCFHTGGLYFDPDEAFAECKICGEKVTLSFALEKMMAAESRARRIIARARLESEEAKKKTMTKCQHCRKMTKIRLDIKDYRILELAQEIKE